MTAGYVGSFSFRRGSSSIRLGWSAADLAHGAVEDAALGLALALAAALGRSGKASSYETVPPWLLLEWLPLPRPFVTPSP